MTRVTRALYRCIMKEIRGLTPLSNSRIFLIEQPDHRQWGHGNFVENKSQVDVLLGLLPPRAAMSVLDWSMTTNNRVPHPEESAEGFTRAQLNRLTKALFVRQKETEDSATRSSAVDEGFEALRSLALQKHTHLCSSSCITNGVHVRCTSIFVPHYQRERGKGTYLFAYRIAVHNTPANSRTVKLLGRHWEILDANGKVTGSVPKGSHGVVGQTPEIEPDQTFEYYSGVELPTSEGRMSGSFQMIRMVDASGGGGGDAGEGAAGAETEGQLFDVIIAPFALRGPTT